jgi:hypothetical protein
VTADRPDAVPGLDSHGFIDMDAFEVVAPDDAVPPNVLAGLRGALTAPEAGLPDDRWDEMLQSTFEAAPAEVLPEALVEPVGSAGEDEVAHDASIIWGDPFGIDPPDVGPGYLWEGHDLEVDPDALDADDPGADPAI